MFVHPSVCPSVAQSIYLSFCPEQKLDLHQLSSTSSSFPGSISISASYRSSSSSYSSSSSSTSSSSSSSSSSYISNLILYLILDSRSKSCVLPPYHSTFNQEVSTSRNQLTSCSTTSNMGGLMSNHHFWSAKPLVIDNDPPSLEQSRIPMNAFRK